MTLAPEFSRIETASVSDLFKEAFGAQPAGVSIITALDPEGNPVGITASSVNSVSAEPPIVSFSLKGNSGSAAELLKADTFLIHLLSADNVQLAKNFATSGCPRFEDSSTWEKLPTGEPLLEGVGRVLRARPHARIEAGPAILLTAEVTDFIRHDVNSVPVVYHARKFHALGEHSEVN